MNKTDLIKYFNDNAARAYQWHKRNRYYYQDLKSFLRFNIEAGVKVLEIGSGTGELLSAVKPSRGVGVDLSAAAVKLAREHYPELDFSQGDIDQGINFQEKFDYIILSDLIGYLDDIQTSFMNLRSVCHRRSRLIVTQYNNIWWPILKLGEFIRLKAKQPIVNWIEEKQVINLMDLAGFEVIKHGRRLLFPNFFPVLSWFFNKILANLPLLSYFCLTEYFILRPKPPEAIKDWTVSVIVPARNEKGNIEEAVKLIPPLGKGTEIIFVEGNSTDGTLEEIRRVAAVYQDKKNLKYFVQDNKGKYDAVKKGFAHAQGDILMILDADLTVPPAMLRRFYQVISSGQADYAQGSRLVYPMAGGAMRFLNYLANKFFGAAFSWLLGQYITDTLCGTKVMFKSDYEKIAAGRKYFGDFDPFGDFDLIFGAAKLNLKLAELPIHYQDRQYGATNISRFKHGFILLKMLFIGIIKLKSN